MWRVCHRLLPTQERLFHHTPGIGSDLCLACVVRGRGEDDQDQGFTGSLQHELLECTKNDGVGDSLMAVLRMDVPGLTGSQTGVWGRGRWDRGRPDLPHRDHTVRSMESAGWRGKGAAIADSGTAGGSGGDPSNHQTLQFGHHCRGDDGTSQLNL